MSNKNCKHPQNRPGEFYCTDPSDGGGEGCIACGICSGDAPDFFAEDDEGNAYVKRQPVSEEERALCREQIEACPVASIGDDG
ncbi:MAG: ferredoxin [Bacteriovoracales bacterium]|nr:ferredoxin [Bacteriovoracales bacterium]